MVSVPAYKESVALDMVAEEEHKETEKKEQEEGRVEKQNTEDSDDPKNNEGVETMNIEEAMGLIAEKDQKIADLESLIAKAEQKAAEEAEEKAEEKAKKDEEAVQAEAELTEVKEALANANSVIAEKEATVAELEAKVTELETMRAELEAMKAEQAQAELAKKVEKAKAFAEKQGLDLTQKEVADAVAEMNYEAIADLASAMEQPAEKAVETIASFVLAGEGIDINEKYGDLLARR